MNFLHPFRRATQLFGLMMTNLYVNVVNTNQIYQGLFKSVCLPFLYCHSCPVSPFACPLGVMQHYAAIHQFPFFLVGHLMIVGLLVGRMVCGWICPVGLFQEMMYKIKTVKIEIHPFWGALPWIMLIVFIIILPFLTAEHWFSKLCPVGTLVAGIPWVLWNPTNPTTGAPTIEPGSVGFLFAVKLIILGVVLWLFVVSKRPFCQFICPMGLFWSFFNKISLLRLDVAGGCKGCNACEKKCPVGKKVYEEANPKDCIRCLECTVCKHVSVGTHLPVGSEPTTKPEGAG